MEAKPIRISKDKRFDSFTTDVGIKIKYKKRCLLCKFADLDLFSDSLLCENKDDEAVEENYFCENFKLSKESKQDIINRYISAV
ncbi:hypothetical protein FE247_05095 [Aliarcobacter cibarius]|uniref:Uncharacterized protein n=2 Tax=Aliarcobacter cibarius TaxID=255507 RepID=A0ABY2V4L6_9BACT|nr:hypothetical protein FE247_05095 [Aliarcobacter cibarius]